MSATEQVNRIIASLESRLSGLQRTYSEILEVRQTTQNSPSTLAKISENGEICISICLGDGWFVDMSPPDAVAFMDRKLSRLETDLKHILDNLLAARRAVQHNPDVFLEKVRSKYGLPASIPVVVPNNPAPEADLPPIQTVAPGLPSPQTSRVMEAVQPFESDREIVAVTELDDALPIMDIREELDEDGNVISTSIQERDDDNRSLQPLLENLTRIIQEREKDISRLEGSDSVQPKKNSSAVVPSNLTPGSSSLDSSTSRLSRASLPPSSLKLSSASSSNVKGRHVQFDEPVTTSDDLSSAEASSSRLVDTESTSPDRELEDSITPGTEGWSINPNDLLTLEVIADEIGAEEEDDIEPIEDLDEWEEDEDGYDEDEDEYGRTSIFPNGIPKPETPNLDASLGSSKRQVTFSPNLDIKTFSAEDQIIPSTEQDNYSDTPEEPQADRKMSRFKSERLLSRPSESKSSKKAVPSKAVSSTAGSVKEQPVADVFERPVGDIMERSNPSANTEEVLVGTAKHSHSEEKSSSNSATGSEVTKTMTRNIFKKGRQAISTRVPVALDPSKEHKEWLQTREPGTDLEESTASGTSVISDDIYELATENFNSAIVTVDQFLEAHDTEDAEADDNDDLEEAGTRPILSDSVLEREGEYGDDNELSDDDYDQHVTRNEIAEEYQRLRQKLINGAGGFKKTQDELAYEPIDENGSEIKVSRFKAARLANRPPAS